MTRIPNHVMNFAGGQEHVALYEAFADYFNHYEAIDERH